MPFGETSGESAVQVTQGAFRSGVASFRSDRGMFVRVLAPFPRDAIVTIEGGRERPVRLGPCMFFPAGVALAFRGEPSGPYPLLFCPILLDDLFADGAGADWSPGMVAAALSLRNADVDADALGLAAEVSRGGLGSARLVASLRQSLAIRVARELACASRGDRGGRLADWQIRRVDERILGVQGQRATAAMLAEACSLSPAHFARCFRRTFGETVHDYAQNARMRHAMWLLANTPLPVKECAFRLGFAHAGAFTVAFTRASGSRPGEFRQRHRAGPPPPAEAPLS